MKPTKIVLSAFVLLAITAFGMAAFRQPPTNETETPIGVVPQARYDTSTWQAYSDDRIAFRYPANWKVEKATYSGASGDITQIDLRNPQGNYFVEGTPMQGISIFYRQSTAGQSENSDKGQTGKTVVIGGNPGTIVQGVNPPVNEDKRVVDVRGWRYDFVNYGGTISAAMGSSELGQEIEGIFDTVLSSVSFTK